LTNVVMQATILEHHPNNQASSKMTPQLGRHDPNT
jgi:hypothetical protein